MPAKSQKTASIPELEIRSCLGKKASFRQQGKTSQAGQKEEAQMSTGEIRPIKNLPWKLSAQSKGFQKALENFKQEYGAEEGLRIFLQKAEEHGQGNTLRQKANSIYRKGGHLSPK